MKGSFCKNRVAGQQRSKSRSYSISDSGRSRKYGDLCQCVLGKTPVNARYVKVSVVKPTQGSDSAARIYEIQVYGTEDELK